MIEKHNCRQIGVIVKTHGITGEIVIRLFDEFSIDDMDTGFLFLDLNGGLVPFHLEDARERNKSDVLVRIEFVNDNNSATDIMDAPVYVEKVKSNDSEEEDVFSAYQLVGYQCFAVEHGAIGIISAIRDISKNPLFEVDNEGREVLIPIVESFITNIDDEKREITFNLPDGLIDLE